MNTVRERETTQTYLMHCVADKNYRGQLLSQNLAIVLIFKGDLSTLGSGYFVVDCILPLETILLLNVPD